MRGTRASGGRSDSTGQLHPHLNSTRLDMLSLEMSLPTDPSSTTYLMPSPRLRTPAPSFPSSTPTSSSTSTSSSSTLSDEPTDGRVAASEEGGASLRPPLPLGRGEEESSLLQMFSTFDGSRPPATTTSWAALLTSRTQTAPPADQAQSLMRYLDGLAASPYVRDEERRETERIIKMKTAKPRGRSAALKRRRQEAQQQQQLLHHQQEDKPTAAQRGYGVQDDRQQQRSCGGRTSDTKASELKERKRKKRRQMTTNVGSAASSFVDRSGTTPRHSPFNDDSETSLKDCLYDSVAFPYGSDGPLPPAQLSPQSEVGRREQDGSELRSPTSLPSTPRLRSSGESIELASSYPRSYGSLPTLPDLGSYGVQSWPLYWHHHPISGSLQHHQLHSSAESPLAAQSASLPQSTLGTYPALPGTSTSTLGVSSDASSRLTWWYEATASGHQRGGADSYHTSLQGGDRQQAVGRLPSYLRPVAIGRSSSSPPQLSSSYGLPAPGGGPLGVSVPNPPQLTAMQRELLLMGCWDNSWSGRMPPK